VISLNHYVLLYIVLRDVDDSWKKNLRPKSCDTVPFLLSIVFAVYHLPLRCLSVGYGYPSRVASWVFVHIRDKCSLNEATQYSILNLQYNRDVTQYCALCMMI
jgi:hypothetical protein